MSMTERHRPNLEGFMAVGDPRRSIIRRAVFGTLIAAATFFALTGPVKEFKPLYNHAPWLNDPFDTVVSFMMFFVPFVTASCLVRLWLCRRFEPLSIARVRDLLRGCRVVLMGIAFTLVTEWIGFVIGGNRSQWDGATWLQIGFLVLMTTVSAKVAVDLHRCSVPQIPRANVTAGAPDWLSDALAVAERQSQLLGPLQGPAGRALIWINRRPLTAVRRHPLWSAAVACCIFGLAAGVNQAVREGYDGPSMVTLISLLSCGTFGLVVGTGSYLGLVRSDVHLWGAKRRAVDAGVSTCLGALVAFAFRYHLWWIVGSNNAAAGVPQLLFLLGMVALLIFASVFVVESLLGSHAKAIR
jgi:hypothetical protein